MVGQRSCNKNIMDEKLKLIARAFGEEKVKFNESMRYHLASKAGGMAKLFAVALSERELIKITEQCIQLNVPFLIVGTGSKIVISELGFDGVVIKNRFGSIKVVSIKGKVGKGNIGVESCTLEVGSGVEMGKFVEYLKKQGLEYEEFENFRGSIGGNIFTNRSLQDKCESIKVLSMDSDIISVSIMELDLRAHIVLSVILKLKAKI